VMRRMIQGLMAYRSLRGCFLRNAVRVFSEDESPTSIMLPGHLCLAVLFRLCSPHNSLALGRRRKEAASAQNPALTDGVRCGGLRSRCSRAHGLGRPGTSSATVVPDAKTPRGRTTCIMLAGTPFRCSLQSTASGRDAAHPPPICSTTCLRSDWVVWETLARTVRLGSARFRTQAAASVNRPFRPTPEQAHWDRGVSRRSGFQAATRAAGRLGRNTRGGGGKWWTRRIARSVRRVGPTGCRGAISRRRGTIRNTDAR
jgi:hypothetical protein